MAGGFKKLFKEMERNNTRMEINFVSAFEEYFQSLVLKFW